MAVGLSRKLGIELDLEVFSGPFDLLLALILREEVDLREVDLAAVVLAYVEHVERSGELDLGAATEFILLVASLLELKSRLLLPEPETEELLSLDPQEAAEELLGRIVEARRYRALAGELKERFEREGPYHYRSVPPPPQLRQLPEEELPPLAPERLAERIGALLAAPAPIDLRHLLRARVSLADCLQRLRNLLAKGRFSFEEAVAGADRLTEAVTVFALLELYRRGEARWEQPEPFGQITVIAERGIGGGDGRAG